MSSRNCSFWRRATSMFSLLGGHGLPTSSQGRTRRRLLLAGAGLGEAGTTRRIFLLCDTLNSLTEQRITGIVKCGCVRRILVQTSRTKSQEQACCTAMNEFAKIDAALKMWGWGRTTFLLVIFLLVKQSVTFEHALVLILLAVLLEQPSRQQVPCPCTRGAAVPMASDTVRSRV
jgi:hypothetical protein